MPKWPIINFALYFSFNIVINMNYYILYADQTLAGPFKTLDEAKRYELIHWPWYKMWLNKYSATYIKCSGDLTIIE